MKINVLNLLATILICTCCKAQLLTDIKSTEFGTFKFSKQDKAVVDDLISTSGKNLRAIARTLRIEIDPNIMIEVYPNQNDYDQNIINSDLKGSPAISGNNKIQMVSPKSKIKLDTISYQNRLMFIIHEYVHLFFDKIEPSPPICLDEGLACYLGSYNFYKSIAVKYVRQLTQMPTITQLLENYYKIRAADLFSFLLVDFLVKSESLDRISTIIRNPQTIKERESEWTHYLSGYRDIN